MEVLKPQNRSADEIIRYLLDTKKQMLKERNFYFCPLNILCMNFKSLKRNLMS